MASTRSEAVLLSALAFFAGIAPGQLTHAQYRAELTSEVGEVLARHGATPAQPSMEFSANALLAHGSIIQAISGEALVAQIGALREAGINSIDINPRLGPWLNPGSTSNAADIAKYDAVVAAVRRFGLKLVFNPAYSAGDPIYTTFSAFQQDAHRAWAELARRYRPDVFTVIHEPSTMEARLGLSVSNSEWSEFVRIGSQVVKDASPGTKTAAGGLPSEIPAYTSFSQIPGLDYLTVDIYDAGSLDAVELMVQIARGAGKPVHVEETWRSANIPVAQPGQPVNPLQRPGSSITDPQFADIDQNWLRAITMWAHANNLEVVTPFYIGSFFRYDAGFERATDIAYNQAVASAILAGERTETFRVYQQLIDAWSTRPPVTVSAANFTGPVTAEAIVTTFGHDFATGTFTASSTSLPTELGGTSVEVRDAVGNVRLGLLIYVSPTQVSFVTPAGLAAGPAQVSVISPSGRQTGVMQLVPTAPTLFAANQQGTGSAAAVVFHVVGENVTTALTAICASPGNCSDVPFSLGPSNETTVVSLFGTGVRGRSSLGSVTVQATSSRGTITMPAAYAGPQPQYTGLDQVNVTLDRSLAGVGQVTLVVIADGVASNAVTVSIQ